MPYVMPKVLASANLSPDTSVLHMDADELEGYEYLPGKDKKVGVRTSILEEKATGCSMLVLILIDAILYSNSPFFSSATLSTWRATSTRTCARRPR